MNFKKFQHGYVVRLERGEEIVAALKDFCTRQNIRLGSVSGIGAADNVTLGFFEPKTKEYTEKKIKENHEIAPLAGNITTMNGEVYLHLHISLGDKNFTAHAGHLKSAVVSATCEIFIHTFDGIVEREFDKDIGLNLMKI